MKRLWPFGVIAFQKDALQPFLSHTGMMLTYDEEEGTYCAFLFLWIPSPAWSESTES